MLKNLAISAVGETTRFTVYWVIALSVLLLGFYAPVAEYFNVIQQWNLDMLKLVANHLPYYLSAPTLSKLRSFVQSEAFLATQVSAVLGSIWRILRWFITGRYRGDDQIRITREK